MRVTKDYDERKKEILDTAERLFRKKGYEKCTINEILKEVGIAKGTFYYYFKSKEEVLNGIISRYTDIIISRADEVLSMENIEPVEKLMRAFMAMRFNENDHNEMIDELHKTENALFHVKTLSAVVTVMAPILVKIIEEGIKKEVWSCKYPLEYIQIFLAASITLTDDGIFELDSNSQMKVMGALISMLEMILNVPEGSFMNLYIQNMM